MSTGGENPVVSFVIASYNHERYVAETVHSILGQDFPHLELILVDDGSSDATASIARQIAATDARMQVHAQPNRGAVNARNRGVLLSRGSYVSVVDSDDVLPPDRAALQVAALDADPAASLVYGDAWIVDREGNRIRRFFSAYPPVAGDFSTELLANYCFVPAPSVMFRRSAFDRSGPFWGPGPHTDYLKWIELGLVGGAVCLRDRQLGCWRLHGENTSRPPAPVRAQQYQDLHGALEEIARRHPDLAARVGEHRLRRRYARCHLMAGFYAVLEGSWPVARSRLAEAYRIDPTLSHALARLSAVPFLNLLAAPLYGLAAKLRGLDD